MLDLQQQIDRLIQTGPEYGVPILVMQNGVAPILQELAKDLNHREYFICQNSQENWLITTIQHRTQTELEKKVIYAFADQVDALQMQKVFTEEVSILSIPVADLIFQLFALQPVDSIIFMDAPGDLAQAKEIAKKTLFDLLQTQLQQFKNHLA